MKPVRRQERGAGTVVLAAQWFGSLADIHATELSALKYSVSVICTNESSIHSDLTDLPYTLIGGPSRLKSIENLGFFFRLLRIAVKIRSGAIFLIDDTWDPRLAAIALMSRKFGLVVHDATPHDETHRNQGWQAYVRKALRRRCTILLCFSNHVRSELEAKYHQPVFAIPLTADLPTSNYNDQDLTINRSGFIAFGRARPYKNFRGVLDGWSLHRMGPNYAGDVLFMSGSPSECGVAEEDVPRDVTWLRAGIQYADVERRLRTSKALIQFYSEASQSGVQVLAASLGLASICTDVGGLPEYQVPGAPIVQANDVEALAAAFDEMADGSHAAALGEGARIQYNASWSPAAAATALIAAIEALSP